jgi:hypothetical protein
MSCLQGTQLNALPVPVPVHVPAAQPAHAPHSAPLPHCESLVHQQGMPDAVQVPDGEDTVSQLPPEQDHATATEVAVSQSVLSDAPLPVQVPVHCPKKFTHFPLEQSASATQRHEVPYGFNTGAGVSVVVHAVPPVLPHATELGAGWQP